MPASLQNGLMIALMVFGFGFVVFFHELGHFLAAKWVGIKVEQFAVGFGQALFAWRKGIGWRVGTTTPEYNKRIEAHLAAKEAGDSKDKGEYTDEQMRVAATELGLGDTEYRLNWIPLGGYVKMLGQDDLKPGADVADPRAYNRKTVGQRMIVVSAGVIMNIILAALVFMVVFRIGFNVPPATVGTILPGSPAQKAGLRPGDHIVTMDGTRQYDFTKVGLNVALAPEGTAVPLDYTRPGVPGVQHTMIQAQRTEPDKKGFLSIGMAAAAQLTGLDPKKDVSEAEFEKQTDSSDVLPDEKLIRPGDTIIAIAGKAVPDVKDSYLLDEALQASNGEPVELTVRNLAGQTRTVKVNPLFQNPFSVTTPLNFAGMEPLTSVQGFGPDGSKAKGKLKPGDVVTAITLNDLKRFPSNSDLREMANKAFEESKKLTIEVLRPNADGTYSPPMKIENVEAAMKTGGGRHGLGIALTSADRVPIVSTVEENSPAKKAGIPVGARILEIDGQKVANWFDVRALLQKAAGDHEVTAAVPEVTEPKKFTLTLASGDVDWLKMQRLTHMLQLRELREPRKTDSLVTAAGWGVTETRDFVLQFYVTLKRMWQGSVGVGNMMGPLGIVTAGAHFASKGMDWLLWFLAMISANLAVVNFLPIPIVDGGLFTFLVIEKIQGKPVSSRTQAVAQIIGFALIISVFLLVTYNDIKRQLGLG